MRSMIVVACLALACGAQAGWVGPPANIALSQDGRNILDTPEVAQARAAHIAALQKASLNNPNPQDDGSYNPAWNNEEYWQRADNKWNGAPANQWNGAQANQWNGAPANQWNAAPAAPAWNAAGPAPVAETPEVAQARAAHLAALSSANAAPAHNQWNNGNNGQWNAGNDNGQWNAANDNGQWNGANDNGQWNAGNDDGQWRSGNEGQWNGNSQNQWNGNQQSQWNGAPSWQGPPAQIRLAHNGAGILDTPEVAAARAAHLAAHAKVGAPAHPQQHW